MRSNKCKSNYIPIYNTSLIIITGNESCPQPQTSEHLAAIEIMKLKHILILQNKIDLVKEGQAKEQHEQIVKFVQGTVAEGAPIIPISAQLKYNIEVCIIFVSTIVGYIEILLNVSSSFQVLFHQNAKVYKKNPCHSAKVESIASPSIHVGFS